MYLRVSEKTTGLTVSEKKTETILPRAPHQTTLAPRLVIEAAGQRCKQTAQLLYLGGIIHENADSRSKSTDGIRLMWACIKRFGPELYDGTAAPLRLKVRMRKAEEVETLLPGV